MSETENVNDLILEELVVSADSLKAHPRNYQGHPPDQIAHLKARLLKFGFYKNIVTARDDTVLAGHGIWTAARELGVRSVPIRRMDLDPQEPRAIELLTGDNEVGHLAERDDRLLSELLKEVQESDEGTLEGTGFDEAMLANLIYVTRPRSEIEDFDAAAHWAGLPDYEPAPQVLKVLVNCESEEDRKAFLEFLGAPPITKKTHGTLSIWWPFRDREKLTPLRFESDGEESGAVEDPS